LAHLILVRHGQATAFEADSDRLSPLGETQAHMLGEYWSRNGIVFNEAYSGSLVRQRSTAELARNDGVPAAEILPELNEYDAESMLRRLAPILAGRDAEFAKLAAANQGDDLDRNRRFQKMFEALLARWVTGELEAPDVETWSSFRERVERGLRRVLRGEARGRRVVVFTSGGPIGVAVQVALGAPSRTALELNWRVRNSSLTEFLFSGDRLSLDSFNATPHLDDPALRTFR
jgi:broad specificity phosphatase PhoE